MSGKRREPDLPDACEVLVVGGGSAGCVLANRLSARGARVLLVEAGSDVPPSAVPADIDDTFPRSYYNTEYAWPGLTARLGALGKSGTKAHFTQGRVLGGGSSIMGMIALRGHPEDYDGWARSGAVGWSWEDVLPYFRRLEHDWDFGGPLHGDAGPIAIRREQVADWPPFAQAVGLAAGRMGFPFIDDMNATPEDGYCRTPLSATASHRVSAVTAYLDEGVRSRANLTIATDATVELLLFDGTKCTGVSVRRGDRRKVVAARHVVVSAGAIHSPALLMRSGIGPARHLCSLGIRVIDDLPGVGANLQNHPVVYLATHLRPQARQARALRPQFITALRFSSGVDGAGPSDMVMLVVNKSSWHGLGHAIGGLGIGLYEPLSTGVIKLASPDPREPPDIDLAMLTHPLDRQRMGLGVALALGVMQDSAVRGVRNELFAAGYSEIVRQLNRPGARSTVVTNVLAAMIDGPAWLRRFLIRHGIAAGDQADERQMTDPGWIDRTVRERGFGMYHVAGTCAMGDTGAANTVVGPDCQVLGVQRLSVVDASIMPRLVRANTNLPVMMIAERAADLMLADNGRSSAMA